MTDESIEAEVEFNKPLNEMLKSMVKERLETLMETEREAFLSKEEPDDVANGYYNRDWETRFGEIEDLEVPRDERVNLTPSSSHLTRGGAVGWRTW